MTKKAQLPVDLNTAEENILAKNLKISPRLAKRILAQRPYQSVDQLDRVWGLDPATLQRILPLVTVLKEEAPAQKTGAHLAGEAVAPLSEPEEAPAVQMEAGAPAEKPSQEEAPQAAAETAAPKPKVSWKTNLVLALILLISAYFRFTGLNWDENHHQHPDERFISMVADQIRGVSGIGAYFDTADSALNPLKYGSYTYGMLPLFFTRLVAQWLKMTEYDAITLVGRAMSGFFDLAAVWMLYLLGKRLYDRRIGLLAAALYAAAVLPIQLSHYFAVDSFSTVFIIGCLYFAVLALPLDRPKEKIKWSNLVYFGLFGFFVGLAGACKVNTLPVFGIILLAGAARLATGWKKSDFGSLLKLVLVGWLLSGLLAFIAFRIFQPYAFSGPGFFGIGLNQRWLDIIREVTDQVAGRSEWPPNHHWTNRPLTYAWTNMVTWGLGLLLGLAGWLGWAWAAWRMWRGDWRRHFLWRRHLLPFAWVTGYFLWQNAQFWRYMRYFLPIYPFVILFAAWALVELYDRTRDSRAKLLANGAKLSLQLADYRNTWKGAAGLLALGLVLAGTYGYALAFTHIYRRPITRIEASRWMLENIPGPLNLVVESPQGKRSYPVSIFNDQVIQPGETPTIDLRIDQDGSASGLTTTQVRKVGVYLYFRLTQDPDGEEIITEGRLALDDDDPTDTHTVTFGDVDLAQDKTYYLHYTIQNSSRLSLSGVELRNEDPDSAPILVDLTLQDEPPGALEGSAKIIPGKDVRLNRLEIGQLRQVFEPTQTTLKISLLKDGDDQRPLAVAAQTMQFSEPGLRLAPALKFDPVPLTAGETVQVRYEVTDGSPLRLQSDAYTLETSWDDALPLRVDGYDGLGGIYQPLNLELYEPDTPDKRERMIQVLDQSDYIVIPSNRAYDAMPRLPLRYPMTLKYYQALFGCDCSGDALEKRAYALEPPFKSQLGFDLVATFESPPTLGPLVFPDQTADESFTVYDHPKVLIFKKSSDFSIDKVMALLESVDLDQVIFQTPMAYTQAPSAMQLSPDRLAAQTAGGAWSSMFNPRAWLNANQVVGAVAWYLLLLLLGWMVFPMIYVALPGLPDRGYPLIRMAGLILVAWLAWFLGSLKILPFTRLTILLSVALILLLNAGLAYRRRQALIEYVRSRWKRLLGVELIFLLVFLFSLNVRLGNPDLWNPWLGGEKPMDFAFFNAILKAVYFPPEHPWFSGHYINYYYYGYVIAAIPTKLLGMIPSIAYNLILPTWFAMTGVGVFCVGFNLVTGLRNGSAGDQLEAIPARPTSPSNLLKAITSTRGLGYLAGIFALIAVLFLGNLYEVRVLWRNLPQVGSPNASSSSPIDQLGAFVSGAVQVIGGEQGLPGDKGRWYFEASRPILHYSVDTPIAEFPYFTFLYADMHPHLLTMPIYALALAWMLGLILIPLSKMKWGDRLLSLVLAGLIFGSFRASHTWDFPTFMGLGVLAIFWGAWRARNAPIRQTLAAIFAYALFFVALASVFYQPFTQSFHTEYASLEFWTGARTPLSDYLFVFGLSLFVILSLLVQDFSSDLRAFYRRWRITTGWRHYRPYLVFLALMFVLIWLWVFRYHVLAFGLPLLAAIAYLIFFKKELSLLRRVAWILFAAGLGLTLLVEVIVLKGDVGRSNMVFRMYLEAWFFLGLGLGAALVDLLPDLSRWPRWLLYAWLSVLGLLLLSAASYPLIATGKKMADRWPGVQNPPHTLDGAAFMLGDAGNANDQAAASYNDEDRLLNLAHDYDAIRYVQEHVSGSPVIVEGNTPEYRWGSRFSVYTGLPSVVGWSWHVRQHNSLLDGAIVDKRINEVNDFYNTLDVQAALRFLSRYQVRYVVLGDLERAYYDAQGLDKFQAMVDQGLLKRVYGDGAPDTTTIFEVTTP